MIKDSYFGNAIFIVPETDDMEHDVICVSRDASRLARRFKIQSLNFKESRGVQAGDALYVFFPGEPVQVKKIANLPGEPIIIDLPEMPNQKKLLFFAVSCMADHTIIVSGGAVSNVA